LAEGVADTKRELSKASEIIAIELQRLAKHDTAAQQELQQDREALDAERAQLGKDAEAAVRQQQQQLLLQQQKVGSEHKLAPEPLRSRQEQFAEGVRHAKVAAAMRLANLKESQRRAEAELRRRDEQLARQQQQRLADDEER
jgi:hypothetical protein